ncbi:hypothetical protein QZH46_28215 [Pseudomonas corrugata]
MTKVLQLGEVYEVHSEELSFRVWMLGEYIGESPVFADSAARDAAIEALHAALKPAQE